MFPKKLLRTVALIHGIGALLFIAHQLPDFTKNRSPVHSEKETQIMSVQADRIKTLRDYCQSGNMIQRDDIKQNMLVNNQYKFIFCYIYKVASTQWIRLIMSLSGFQQSSSSHHFLHFHKDVYSYPELLLISYPYHDIIDKLYSFKNVIFVREPLERLLSAYRDKISKIDSYNERFSDIRCFILKKYRGVGDVVCKNSTPTFKEFIDYIIDHFSSDYNETTINKHWERYTRLCSPCSFQYDFIGKYETFQDDVKYVLKSLRSPAEISMISRSEWYSSVQKTSDTFREYYSKIDIKTVRKLLDFYMLDYAMFGYDINETLRKTGLDLD